MLGGDFNVCPTDDDVFDRDAMADDALCQAGDAPALARVRQPRLHRRLQRAASRAAITTPSGTIRPGRWPRDEGLRIDHLMLSPQAADLLEAVDIDREPRKQERPSDHTPIWAGWRSKRRSNSSKTCDRRLVDACHGASNRGDPHGDPRNVHLSLRQGCRQGDRLLQGRVRRHREVPPDRAERPHRPCGAAVRRRHPDARR